MTTDSVSQIEKWVRHNMRQNEDPIPKHAEGRIYRQIAEGIKRTTPLKSGVCSICGNHDDILVPVTMRVCKQCVKYIIQKSGGVNILKTEPLVRDFYCDMCLNKSFTAFTINPKICQKCARKIGKTHMYNKEWKIWIR